MWNFIFVATFCTLNRDFTFNPDLLNWDFTALSKVYCIKVPTTIFVISFTCRTELCCSPTKSALIFLVWSSPQKRWWCSNNAFTKQRKKKLLSFVSSREWKTIFLLQFFFLFLIFIFFSLSRSWTNNFSPSKTLSPLKQIFRPFSLSLSFGGKGCEWKSGWRKVMKSPSK